MCREAALREDINNEETEYMSTTVAYEELAEEKETLDHYSIQIHARQSHNID
jgi:hypothetical protein